MGTAMIVFGEQRLGFGAIGEPVTYPPYKSTQTERNFVLKLRTGPAKEEFKEWSGDVTEMNQLIDENHFAGDNSRGKLAREYLHWEFSLVKSLNEMGQLQSFVSISWIWQNHWHQIKRDGTITSNNGRIIRFQNQGNVIFQINDATPTIWETTWPVSGCGSGPQTCWERDRQSAVRHFQIDNSVFDRTDNIMIIAQFETFYGCP